jgi:1-acyl-sn-glycerol-3-phosphate acyltransferase
MSDLFSTVVYEFFYWTFFFIYVIGFRLRAYGLRNIPRRGAVLIIANHQSYLDPVGIGLGYRRHVYYLARKSLFRNSFAGWWLRTVQCVPIDQEGVGKEGIRNILARLTAGKSVMVFPEGNRTDDGEFHELRPGIGLLVSRDPAPILPAAIVGAYETWSRHQKVPHFSPLFFPISQRSLTVVYGKPRDPATLADLPREEMLRILHDDIEACLKEAESISRNRLMRGSALAACESPCTSRR